MRLLISLVLLVALSPYAGALNSLDRAELSHINSLQDVNPGFESGTVKWSGSGGTFTINSTPADQFVAGSKQFAVWDSDGAAQERCSALVKVPQSGNCSVGLEYRVPSGTATHKIVAKDGSKDLAIEDVVSSTSAMKHEVEFPCASAASNQARVCLRSVASNEPAIQFDSAYAGYARNVGTVAQALYKGSIIMTGCTDWTRSNGTFGNFTATSGCTYTVTGDVLAPSTFIPGFRLQNVAPGRYFIVGRGYFGKSVSTTNVDVSFRFSDGTSTFAEQIAVSAASSSGQSIGVGEITGSIGYTAAQSTLTFQVQGQVSTTASSTAAVIRDDGGAVAGSQIGGLQFEVFYFPTTSQQVVTPDAQGWWAAGYISGASVSLGTTAVTTYQEATNGSLTLTPDSGSAPMGITCSSANAAATPSTGATTCSAGNESLGFSVNVPRAGRYEVCGQFGHNVASSAGDAGINVAFEWVNTATNSQTIVARMGPRTTSGHYNNPASGQSKFGNVTACGQVTLSAGVTAFRLFYEQSIPGTNGPSTNVINIDADANIGDRAMRVTMRPITGEQQAILANSVSTQVTNGVTEETAIITCSGSSGIDRQLGTWVSSVGNISSGVCAVTVNGFNGTPYCDVNGWGSGVSNVTVRAYCSSSTACEVSGYNTATGVASTAFTAKFSCKAQR